MPRKKMLWDGISLRPAAGVVRDFPADPVERFRAQQEATAAIGAVPPAEPAGNATTEEWAAYAAALGVEVPEDAGREAIKALVDAQGAASQPSETPEGSGSAPEAPEAATEAHTTSQEDAGGEPDEFAAAAALAGEGDQ